MKRIIILLLFAIATLKGKTQCRIDYSNWNLVLDENFDTITSVNSLSSRWQFYPSDRYHGLTDDSTSVDSLGNPVAKHAEYGEYYDQSQVSIQPGGILRLTGQRLSQRPTLYTNNGTLRKPTFVSGMLMLRKDLFSSPLYDTGSDETGQNKTGFMYGMFEARIKLPPTPDCFPAFWLETNKKTEIDIFEYGLNDTEISNAVIDWYPTNPPPGVYPVTCQQQLSVVNGLHKLSSDFHTFSCVWTPAKVTIFLDGHELRTVDSSQMPTGATPAAIWVDLAMPPWNYFTNSNYMDIDYIRVYRPKNNNYSLSYKNASEQIFHDVSQSQAPLPKNVSDKPNSIAPNTTNANEIFYRGSDDYLYVAKKVSNVWTSSKIPYTDGSTNTIKGDVRYLPLADMILFVGSDNRINFFGRSTTEPSGFYHSELSYNSSCYWCQTDDLIYPAEGSLQTTSTAEIFYRGYDNKMHHYYPSGGNWYHEIFPLAVGSGTDLVKGDIVFNPVNKSVFYKGSDNRLQSYYLNSANVYTHTWINNSTPYLVNSAMGSMAWAPAIPGVVYAGIDSMLHVFSFNGSTGWHHQLVSYTYNGWAPTGYANADYIKGGLTWDNTNKMAMYFGNDGRLQCFGMGANITTWNHFWLNDYFNTEQFDSYNSLQIGKNSSIILSPDATFFSHATGHLAYFKYESCERLDPTCWIPPTDSNPHPPTNVRYTVLRQHQSSSSVSASDDIDFEVFPNPTQDNLTVSATHDNGIETTNRVLNISDISGKTLIHQSFPEKSVNINMSLLPTGMYMLSIIEGGREYHYKISKQ